MTTRGRPASTPLRPGLRRVTLRLVPGDDEAFKAADGSRRTFAWSLRKDGRLAVSVRDERGRALARFRLASRFHGNFGGSRIVISPGGAFAALFMHSGQSEQGYELFAVGDEVRRLTGVPFTVGHGGPPIFAPDASRLVLVNFWPGAVHRVDALRVAYAELFTQSLRPAEPPRRHRLIVDSPDPAALGRDFHGPRKIRFIGADTLSFTLPGDLRAVVALPADDEILVSPAPP